METQKSNICVIERPNSTCTNISSHYAQVNLPIKLKPYAKVGMVEMKCCGEPYITMQQNHGADCACRCEITINQTICIKIPVEYGARVNQGNPAVSMANDQQCQRCPRCGKYVRTALQRLN